MNLPLPSIPTDNLYKFVAIAGLVMILAGLIIPQLTIRKVDELVSTTEGILKYLENAKEAGRDLPHEKREDMISLIRQNIELGRSGIRQWKFESMLASAIIVTGVIFAFLGFLLWYFRVQRHMDKILVIKARYAEQDCTANPMR